MNSIVRWIVFLPASVVASLISAFCGYYAGRSFGDTAAQTSAAFFGALASVVIAGLIAPSRRAGVTIIIASTISLFALTAFALSEFTSLDSYVQMSGSLKVLIPVAQILGGIYGIFSLQQLLASKLDVLLRAMRQLVCSVVLMGLFLTVVGIIVGIVTRQWLGLFVGLGVLGLACVTWLLQKLNLLSSSRRVLRQRTGA